MQASHKLKQQAKHLIESGNWSEIQEFVKNKAGEKFLATEPHEQKKREEIYLSLIAMKYLDEVFVELANSLEEEHSTYERN